MSLPAAGAELDSRTALDPRQLAELRAERFLATGRLVLAALSLFGLWLEPGEPAQHAALGYSVAASYVLLAIAGAASAWEAPALLLRWRLVVHVLDLLAFCAIIYFTNGATSPFFAYLVFALIAAALRWQWRGVLATAAGAVAAYSLICAVSIPAGAGQTVLLTVTVRIVYLAVFAILLGYLSSYYGGLRRELEELVSWTVEGSREPSALMRQLLDRAAAVLESRTVLLLLREDEEPAMLAARREGQSFRSERLPLDAYGEVVAPDLQRVSFVAANPAADATVHCLDGTTLRRWRGRALDPRLARVLDEAPLLALRLAGRLAQGWLLAAGRRGFSGEQLLLGSLVARQVESQLDQLLLGRQEQRAAAALERMRLARDLHDGIIQSLSGATLRLQTVGRLLDDERPEEARLLLDEVDEVLVTEQQELRWFLAEGRSGESWLQRVEQLPERLARSWGLCAWIEAEVDGARLPSELGHEIYRLVQEALVNAARHGGARTASALLRDERDAIHITITDDGQGFPFHGDLDDAALRERRLGPVSIKQRVGALGGTLHICSSESGARLDIVLPRAST
ncbi:MAG TPA: histidine kinase [Thermoanaerobaculia bacterium]|nr:histidine kinase [Thermoanaerobaculia bacterium]